MVGIIGSVASQDPGEGVSKKHCQSKDLGLQPMKELMKELGSQESRVWTWIRKVVLPLIPWGEKKRTWPHIPSPLGAVIGREREGDGWQQGPLLTSPSQSHTAWVV